MTLGEKLRQAREERGISISEVAEQTRISPLYLKSIESDDYKPLPGGIFNKGFLRSYARYIGFDENEALSEYAQQMAEHEVDVDSEPKPYRPEVMTDDDRSLRSMAPSLIFALFVLAMLAGGVALLVRYLNGGGDTNLVATNSSNSANSSPGNTNSNNAAPTPTPGTFVVELKALTDRIWVGYTLDGTKAEKILDPTQPVKLDVNESVKMGFAKVKIPNLELSINGKRINIFTTGSRGNIEFEINKANANEIFQRGEIGTPPPVQQQATTTPVQQPTSLPTQQPTPLQQVTPAATATPRPTQRPPRTPRPTPRPLMEPTIVPIPTTRKTPNT